MATDIDCWYCTFEWPVTSDPADDRIHHCDRELDHDPPHRCGECWAEEDREDGDA